MGTSTRARRGRWQEPRLPRSWLETRGRKSLHLLHVAAFWSSQVWLGIGIWLRCLSRSVCPCESWIKRLQRRMKDELLRRSPEVPMHQTQRVSALPLADDVWSPYLLMILVIILTSRLSIWEVQRKFICIILSISRSFL